VNRLVLLPWLVACGARTELGGIAEADASLAPDVHDASIIDVHDASLDVHDAQTDDAAPPPPCDFGDLEADPFGTTTSWNGGASLPSGHYRVTYVDGCMKYSSSQGWTINAYANGPDTLYVVQSNQAIAPAPGTVGFYVNQGAFASFDACVAANLNDAPLEFDVISAGPIGLHLVDDPYTDNVAGENGRNPTYHLSSCK
jgi:hypothetical protein